MVDGGVEFNGGALHRRNETRLSFPIVLLLLKSLGAESAQRSLEPCSGAERSEATLSMGGAEEATRNGDGKKKVEWRGTFNRVFS